MANGTRITHRRGSIGLSDTCRGRRRRAGWPIYSRSDVQYLLLGRNPHEAEQFPQPGSVFSASYVSNTRMLLGIAMPTSSSTRPVILVPVAADAFFPVLRVDIVETSAYGSDRGASRGRAAVPNGSSAAASSRRATDRSWQLPLPADA